MHLRRPAPRLTRSPLRLALALGAAALLAAAAGCAAEQAASPGPRTAGGGGGGATRNKDVPPGWGEKLPEPPPDNMPFMQLSSDRCKGRNIYKQGCACRPLDGEPDTQVETLPVAPGGKRYEVRIYRTAQPTVVAVGGIGRAYRNEETPAEFCYYMDYGPGNHLITYQTKIAPGGDAVRTGIALYEYNPKIKRWYHVFEQRCGSSETGCGPEPLREWRQSFVGAHGGLLNRCASTRVRAVRWGGRRSTSNTDAYDDLIVEFLTKTYRFLPLHPPGSALCKGRLPRE